MSTKQLELSNVSLQLGGKTVLDKVNLVVAPGEVVALLGASGAGKSSLLRSVSGLERLASGRVLINGEDVTDLQPSRRGCAMVADTAGLFEDMTVAENIFAVAPRSPRREQVVQLALISLDIEHLARRFPHELSTGESQKVALARSLVRRPQVLLFDEPLAHVDPGSRKQLLEELLSLHTRLGCATLYVTHDIWEAYEVADRICYLQQGRVIQDDVVEEVHDFPANVAIAKHLGATNFIPVRAEATRNELGENIVCCRALDQDLQVLASPQVMPGACQDLLLVGYPASVEIFPAKESVVQGKFGQVIGLTYQGEQYLARIETELGVVSTWLWAKDNNFIVGDTVNIRLHEDALWALPLTRVVVP
ncbi:MAG: ABC transporter ATP-binding protein [Actinomycetaceae bacterium]|nr:ABC transporter ATP-binding protein [Actinomycetaceae bacterium]